MPGARAPSPGPATHCRRSTPPSPRPRPTAHSPPSACLVFLYVALQTFAIPGPLVLSLIAGGLYPPLKAQAIIAACATTGACACYMLSALLARPLVAWALPGRLADMRARVEAHRDSLPYYLLFLRLTPLVPNWAVNLSAPAVGVPFTAFALTTCVGLLPANYFHVATGATLATLAAAPK